MTETSRDCEPNDIPYYPLRLAGDEPRLQRYLEAAKATVGTSFTGRLATYRYIDMDVAIAEALNAGEADRDGPPVGTGPTCILHCSG